MAKTKIGDRQMARIVAAVTDKALSCLELSALLHMSQTSVDRFITRMLGQKPKRVHIESWRETARNPIRLVRAGAGQDAKYVCRKARKQLASRFADAARRRAEILTLLAMPQTSAQLAARMKLRVSSVTRFLREHRAAGRIHIKGWILPTYRGSQSPVYALGSCPDKQRVRRSRERAAPKPIAAWAPMLTTLLCQPAAQDHLPQAA